ncbi:HAD hydrolase family protein [Curtobacterium flaccumfaciens]|nr:HAD hydrolase family protein [Curtobacterium flaccumfaciens]
MLQTIHGALENAAFGVEDETGHFLLSGNFPDDTMTVEGEHVPFEQLLGVEATRVVVISPGHDTEDFLQIVEQMGLHKVSYSVGWTSWLDIAPEGVTKATAMERVREWLDIPRSRVFAAGDGRNDIDMLRWASTSGRGIVMGQAPRRRRRRRQRAHRRHRRRRLGSGARLASALVRLRAHPCLEAR